MIYQETVELLARRFSVSKQNMERIVNTVSGVRKNADGSDIGLEDRMEALEQSAVKVMLSVHDLESKLNNVRTYKEYRKIPTQESLVLGGEKVQIHLF